jgi:hypothetical protein
VEEVQYVAAMSPERSHDMTWLTLWYSPADGDHQALLKLPSNWRELATDGTVWKQSLDWYDTFLRRARTNADLDIGTGTLFRASQFLSEELPIRLAHRVQELGDLPDGLNEMESIKRVQDWYAQSFEVCQNKAIVEGMDVRTDTLPGNHHSHEAESKHRNQRTTLKARKRKWEIAHTQ